MAKFTFYVPKYKDEIIVDNYVKRQKELVESCKGYQFDEDGECAITMQFRDGIAYTEDGSGLAMTYPTLAQVEQSEKMQDAIYEHTGRTDANQFDVALTFGRLVKYKTIADYDKWQGDGKDFKEVYAIVSPKDVNKHLFDVAEPEFCEMADRGLVNTEGYYDLTGNPTKDKVERLMAKYGILWTDCIQDQEAA